MRERIAVIYFTKGGAAEFYAGVVAEELRDSGHDVTVIDLRETRKPSLEPYSTIVLGTGVRIGMVYWRARRFLRRKDVRNKTLAVFLASGIAIEDPDKARRKFLEPVIEKRGLTPIMLAAFPGMTPIEPGKYEDTTDAAPARAWVASLAGMLGSGRNG